RVDQVVPPGRMLQQVEVDLDGLGAIFEARSLRVGMMEVEETLEGHLPVGGGHLGEADWARRRQPRLHVREGPRYALTRGRGRMRRLSAPGEHERTRQGEERRCGDPSGSKT